VFDRTLAQERIALGTHITRYAATGESENAMAILRETIGTLRAYMLVVGSLGTLLNLSGLLSGEAPLWVKLLALPALALSLALLYFGVTLGTQLRERPSAIVRLFVAAMVIQGGYAVSEIMWAVAHGQIPIPISAVGFLIAWYLYAQSKRLVREQEGVTVPAA
jgi:hypothetical protein